MDCASDVREDCSSEEEDFVDEPVVNPSEAFDALEVSLRWLEQRKADPSDLLLVKKWRDEAARIRVNNLNKHQSSFSVQ